MKNFSTIMLVIFMIMFWGFRLIVAFTYEIGKDLGGITPINQQMEIILLFVVLVCILLVIKRKLIGALIYLVAYVIYFGTNLTVDLTNVFSSTTGMLDINLYMSTFVSIIGIALPIAVLLDLLVDKNRKINPKNKQTDWFYTNEAFDRKLDERADKNNYRTM